MILMARSTVHTSEVVSLDWNDLDVKRHARGALKKGMSKAVKKVKSRIRQRLNVRQPTRRTRSGRLVGLNPSKAWEDPKRLTGKYRASIKGRVKSTRDEVVGTITSDMPYSNRLEYGFIGTDSLGRTYNQAPRPTIRRTIVEMGGEIVLDVAAGAQAATKASYPKGRK